jgi:hypothetical protein
MVTGKLRWSTSASLRIIGQANHIMRYLIFTTFLLFSITTATHAASLSLRVPDGGMAGEQFSVDVVADTGGVPVNSVEAAITYPSDTIEFIGYQESAGMVRFWIQPPHAEGNTVSFAGGIPGGAARTFGTDSQTVPLVRLLFASKRPGTATFDIDHSLLLINDGKGTELAHANTGTTVSVAGAVAGVSAESDTTPPASFVATLIPRDRATNTPMLLSFNTHDRETGISGFQVRRGWGSWNDAHSPYPVSRGLFSTKATVRAYDLSGNFQSSSITIPGIVPIPCILGALLILAVIGSGLALYFVVKNKI